MTKYAGDEGKRLLDKIALGEETEKDLMRYRVLADLKKEVDGIIRTAKMKHDVLKKMKEEQ